MKFTYLMENHHNLVKRYLYKYFNIFFYSNEIYKTHSFMYGIRYVLIIIFTGSRFNYTLVDFDKQKIIVSCVTWKKLINTLKNTSLS